MCSKKYNKLKTNLHCNASTKFTTIIWPEYFLDYRNDFFKRTKNSRTQSRKTKTKTRFFCRINGPSKLVNWVQVENNRRQKRIITVQVSSRRTRKSRNIRPLKCWPWLLVITFIIYWIIQPRVTWIASALCCFLVNLLWWQYYSDVR